LEFPLLLEDSDWKQLAENARMSPASDATHSGGRVTPRTHTYENCHSNSIKSLATKTFNPLILPLGLLKKVMPEKCMPDGTHTDPARKLKTGRQVYAAANLLILQLSGAA
jgi:hypothetical protein